MKEMNPELKKTMKHIIQYLHDNKRFDMTIEKNYLPELFDNDFLSFSESNGLPAIKQQIVSELNKKGFSITQHFENVSIRIFKECVPFIKENFDSDVLDQKFLSELDNQKRFKAYQFISGLEEFKELPIDPDVDIVDLLDEDFILLFIDPKHYCVWLWHGRNTTTRMKFISAKLAQPIRDKYGIAFKIIAVDQGNETHAFRVMIGKEGEVDYEKEQAGSASEGSEEDLKLLQSLSREKILLILEKAGIPEGYERKMVILKDQIYGYKEIKRNYRGSVIVEPQLFPLKEKLEDRAYLAEGYIPKIHISKGKVIMIELLKRKIAQNGGDFDDDDRYPYPHIFKPREPPDGIAPASQTQRKRTKEKEESHSEHDCPYCGYKLSKGQKYCPICGKDVY